MARKAVDRGTYTILETARRLGISKNYAYEAARRGDIPVIKIGNRILVPRVALERLLETATPTKGEMA